MGTPYEMTTKPFNSEDEWEDVERESRYIKRARNLGVDGIDSLDDHSERRRFMFWHSDCRHLRPCKDKLDSWFELRTLRSTPDGH